MTTRVPDFAAIGEEFDAYVGAIGYATMVTVDARHRPRTRVLIPVWEVVDGAPLGWLATFPTPVKLAHLAGNPHANFSYSRPATTRSPSTPSRSGPRSQPTSAASGSCTAGPARPGRATTWAPSGVPRRTRSSPCCASRVAHPGDQGHRPAQPDLAVRVQYSYGSGGGGIARADVTESAGT
jgi:hypothetical protein